jgi:hypothetical protein
MPLPPSGFPHLKHTQSQIQTCKSLAAMKPPSGIWTSTRRIGRIRSWGFVVGKPKVSNTKFGELNRPLFMGTFEWRKVPSENYDMKDKRVLIGFGGSVVGFSNCCRRAMSVLWFWIQWARFRIPQQPATSKRAAVHVHNVDNLRKEIDEQAKTQEEKDAIIKKYHTTKHHEAVVYIARVMKKQ